MRLSAAIFAAVVLMPVSTFAQNSGSSSSASGFSWFANAPSASALQSRAHVRARMVINSSQSWICSPAGSGRRSTCVSG
jgi:hypothetical protein